LEKPTAFPTMKGMTLEQNKLDAIEQAVRQCGLYARNHQRGIHTTQKQDGTPVTESDLFISHTILTLVGQLFPEANIISEEETTPFREEAPYTFVLDPIDGTDMYSQGFPSYAIALGILDGNRKPVGAIIEAPRFGVNEEGLSLRLDPGKPLLVDGKPFNAAPGKDTIRQITSGSDALKHLSFPDWQGKFRCFGSSILHLLAPVIFNGIQGCIEYRGYVWDVTASHAVLKSQGMDIFHADGSSLAYDDAFLKGRNQYAPPIYAGTAKGTAYLRTTFPPKR